MGITAAANNMIKRTMLGFGAIAVTSAVALIGAFALAIVLVSSASLLAAGGTLDQTFIGNPKCSPPAYDGRANSASDLKQEFVPTNNSLTGIDICIIPPEDHNISFEIRHGTIEQPGDPLYGGGFAAYPGDDGWVHIDVPYLIVVPGQPLIIEAHTAFEDFTWISTCGSIADGCTHIDPDQYPAGKSSIPGVDLAFRSYGASGPTPTEFITPTPFLGPPPYPPYDVTCDYVVNLDDVLDLLRRTAGLEDRPACPPPLIAGALPQSDGSSVSLRLDPHFGFSEPGADLTVSIQADIGQVGLGSYRAFVTYDQRELTPTSCSVTCNLAWSADTVALADINLSGWTGTATLASVVFKVIAGPGSYPSVSLTADQLADALGNPIVDCVSSGAKFYIGSLSPTATASPSPSAPTITLSPSPTPPLPRPYPCDYWPPADLGCEGPTTAFVALVVLDYIEYGFNRFPIVCPPTSTPK